MPVGDRDHSEGPADAPLVVVQYGDYQCPYCGAAYPIVKRIQKELGGKLRFVFRNYPITESHPQAEWAAETAEAAAAQGKFWQIQDFLYENQSFMGDEGYFANEEAKLNLDARRIAREVASRAYSSRIKEDFDSGVRSGVNGTPTFFINGMRYDDSYEFDSMISALRSALRPSPSRKK